MPDLACIVHAIVLMAVRFELQIWWKAQITPQFSIHRSAWHSARAEELPPWLDRITEASAGRWLSLLGGWFNR